ncbi:MAG: hypothetical protein NVS9B9_21430 [Ktedonobacteraceae bacterium]
MAQNVQTLFTYRPKYTVFGGHFMPCVTPFSTCPEHVKFP